MALIKRNTAYSVNDIVNTTFGIKLKCTTAGTTSTDPLILDGTSPITDGTVVWELVESSSGSGNGLNDWVANTQYKIDSIVVNDGQIYKALVEFTSGSTFENIEILEDYELQTGDTSIPWAEGIEISTNDIVEYNGNYYKALYDFTCGSIFTKNVFEEYVPKSLTDEEVEEVINSYTPEFSGDTGGENYSTEEKLIGTWIDGKPLYQKTVQFTTPNAAGDQQYSFLPDIPFASIDTLVNVDGFVIRTDGWRVTQDNMDGDFYFTWCKSLNLILFRLTTYPRGETTNKQAVLTFKYTKTAD